MILEFLPEASAELYAAAEYYEKEGGLDGDSEAKSCRSGAADPRRWPFARAMNDYRRIAELAGAVFVDPAEVEFAPNLLRRIPAELVRKYRVLPVAEVASEIAIVTSDPTDLDAFEELNLVLDKQIEVRVADKAQLDSFIEQLYGKHPSPG